MNRFQAEAHEWLRHAHEVAGKILVEQDAVIWFDWTITPGVVTATLNRRTTTAEQIEMRFNELAEALDLTPWLPIRLGPCETRLLALGSRDHVDLVVTATLFTSPLMF